ncbi:CLUMA_CG000657, isoform A [Clunio marinus]|uniref:CLUMA_CG000657, isoform A n=1 Tax=Clunio marinus TaxID=568069 RepID=A0A1J1HHD1_9DIPT|nr:CLUMA_CG000657, isoform A [Clunio marinus]
MDLITLPSIHAKRILSTENSDVIYKYSPDHETMEKQPEKLEIFEIPYQGIFIHLKPMYHDTIESFRKHHDNRLFLDLLSLESSPMSSSSNDMQMMQREIEEYNKAACDTMAI